MAVGYARVSWIRYATRNGQGWRDHWRQMWL